MAADEQVEVVDDAGNVIDIVTRAQMRAGNLRHRCTYVAVVTSNRELVVHQRAAWKDVYPSFWDVCFGGVCEVGEGWDISAARELAEEAGISGQALTDLGPVRWDDPEGRLLGRVYIVTYDGPLTCPDGEVVAVDTVPLGSIDAWLTDRRICPDSLHLALPLVRAHLDRASS